MAVQARKKWMIFMRESDGTHFLYNGEGCVRASPVPKQENIPSWHDKYGELDPTEKLLLDSTLDSPRKKIFELIGYGRYQVIARGEFRE